MMNKRIMDQTKDFKVTAMEKTRSRNGRMKRSKRMMRKPRAERARRKMRKMRKLPLAKLSYHWKPQQTVNRNPNQTVVSLKQCHRSFISNDMLVGLLEVSLSNFCYVVTTRTIAGGSNFCQSPLSKHLQRFRLLLPSPGTKNPPHVEESVVQGKRKMATLRACCPRFNLRDILYFISSYDLMKYD